MSVYSTILYDVAVYVGTPMFIIGVLSNSINVCVFRKGNLQNPSTFLLLIASCMNILYLHFGLLVRVLANGYNIDVTVVHVSWCKIRYYLLQFFALSSISCVCYAIIDQFCASSHQEKWRRLSRISLTRKMVLIISIFWMLYSIPLAIFSDVIRRSNGIFICTIFAYDPNFPRYATYFNLPVIWGITPIVVLTIFGSLTYRNISLLRGNFNRERAQRHLTSMILLHVIFIVMGTVPFAFFYTYLGITLTVVKSPDRLALENLLESIVSLISYFSYSSSFFVYYFSSTTYRDQVKQLLNIFRIHRQVAP